MNTSQSLLQQIRMHSVTWESMDDLEALIHAIGDADIVLLGEASHGTSEFYKIRAELTKRLIREKQFSFIAVEGDWPSCSRVNSFIKQTSYKDESGEEALSSFNRWPTWMWANEEISELTEWLRATNVGLEADRKIGFYGLDLYSLWESMDEIMDYMKRTNSEQLELARKAFACFESYGRDSESYGISAALFDEGCENEVVDLLKAMKKQKEQTANSSEPELDAELNALVALNAEKYYRAMVRGGPASWNVRDHHMVEAFNKIKQFHAPGAKAIVWEHNTHIGDARATDMAEDGMVNVGQLLREDPSLGRVYAIGFGTYSGTVIAGSSWEAPMEVMEVPPAQNNSWESLMHEAGQGSDQLLLFSEHPDEFHSMIGHRAIGVVYHPYNEYGNYVPSDMGARYDAFIHVDESHALKPLTAELLCRESITT
jgi:erythromycin esterase-like protein